MRRVTMLWMAMGLMLALMAGAAFAGLGSSITGTNDDDRLQGTPGNDRIFALAGKDFVQARGGNDFVHGGANDDRINGRFGNDTLIGGTGQDTILGGFGNDRINAVDNNTPDFITCGPGFGRVAADPRDLVARDCERVFVSEN